MVARAREARAAAAGLAQRTAALHQGTRDAVAASLGVRDKVADVVWACDLERRNPQLASHLADTRRRLAAAVGRSPEIEQAATIVTARYGCSPTEAFALMRSVSQRTNRKLAVVARSIVDQGNPARTIGEESR